MIQEEIIYDWWQYYARHGKQMTICDHQLKIIESGILNTARGPDFISARFEFDGVIYQGDVECHVHRNDWMRHKHQLDKAYRSVLLHIVADPADLRPVRNNWNRYPIPTICLTSPGADRTQVFKNRSASMQNLSDKQLCALLQKLAIVRLENKIKKYISLLEQNSEDQVFYEYFLRVLGYPHNADAFQFLAQTVPWSWLSDKLPIDIENTDGLIALYAGQAGFIPTNPPDQYTEQLSTYHRSWVSKLPSIPMLASQWQFAATRPKNHPHSRLAAWAKLLSIQKYTLKEQINNHLIMRADPVGTCQKIIQLLSVEIDGYWASHYALGKRLSEQSAQFTIGKSRIIELFINVIIPFFSAKAILNESDGFRAYLTEFFLSLPLKQSYAGYDKKYSFLNRAKQLWPSQAIYQGCIQLSF